MLFGKKPEANPIYRRATIYTTANPETYPPILVATSDADPLCPHSVRLIEHLQANGFRHEVAIRESDRGSGHVFNVAHPDREDGKDMNDRIAEFFKRTMQTSQG